MKTKTKQPKRLKLWVNTYEHSYVGHPLESDAQKRAWPDADRVAVPCIELRRGEVVVDAIDLIGAKHGRVGVR